MGHMPTFIKNTAENCGSNYIKRRAQITFTMNSCRFNTTEIACTACTKKKKYQAKFYVCYQSIIAAKSVVYGNIGYIPYLAKS